MWGRKDKTLHEYEYLISPVYVNVSITFISNNFNTFWFTADTPILNQVRNEDEEPVIYQAVYETGVTLIRFIVVIMINRNYWFTCSGSSVMPSHLTWFIAFVSSQHTVIEYSL